MFNRPFNFYNNVIGFLVFGIAAFTYLSTIEPSTSLWDTGEFIAASYKLQVVHPPGAPFFLMFNRLFAMLAGNPENVAMMVNASSGLVSALTVLFLFWSITAISRKMFGFKASEVPFEKIVPIISSGIIGALAFTWSDTFWFSAVEGEVYALSITFMGAIFWLMFKWDERADNPGNARWLILIAFLIGLSMGVHLLSLLVTPALAFIYYFRKFEPSRKGILITSGVGLAILAFFNVGVLKILPAIAAKIELLFVNSFGLPFWSGIFFAVFLFFGLSAYGIYYSHIKGKVVLNIAIISFVTVLISYSSYAMVVIRSNANPSLDMNDPETVFNLISYLNREQYGDRPLVKGPDFTVNPTGYDDGGAIWEKSEDEYIKVGYRKIPRYNDQDMTYFPRLGDTRADRQRDYRKWLDLKNNEKPTFNDNIKFFFRYQLGHMYWRYFAWNFIGRQNGEQGFGHDFRNGNWLGGVPFLDNIFANVGPQEELPYEQRWDKGFNKLYYLPFLLGILGLIFHFKQSRESFAIVTIFFVMTGIALIVYSNQPPIEPRERDYVLVGSFFAFCIWIGMSVFFISNLLEKALKPRLAAIAAFAIALVAGPINMVRAEWDDHDRSHRYIPREFAKNYLKSCGENAVLFTNGDNETYPVWYVQEVEGYRTDVRTINLSLLSTDWYHKQLRNDNYESEGLFFSIPVEKLVEGKRDYARFQRNTNVVPQGQSADVKDIIDFIASDDQRTKLTYGMGETEDYYPVKQVHMDVDKKAALKNGVVEERYADRIVDQMKFNINKNIMLRGDILLMDFIAHNNWKRPVCFAITSGSSAYMGLQKYFRFDGMVYTLTPILSEEKENQQQQDGWVNTDRLYDLIMNQYEWGNMDSRELFIDGVMIKQCKNYRSVFARLAEELIKENDFERAENVLDKCLEVTPEYNVPFDITLYPIVESYYRIGQKEKGMDLAQQIAEHAEIDLNYYSKVDREKQKQVRDEIGRALFLLQRFQALAERAGQEEFAASLKQSLEASQRSLM